jgi:hypothetical protein
MRHYRFCPRCQFDLQRTTTAPQPADQLVLPFAEREYIDIKRTMRILGVGHSTVCDMYDAGLFDMLDYAVHKRKRVHYQSLVDFCDRLRTVYGIADRRPALDAPYLRHKDADLLPFPLDDTIKVENAVEIMGYSSPVPIYKLIDEGKFDAYQLTPGTSWRISRSSLIAYMQSLYEKDKINGSR